MKTYEIEIQHIKSMSNSHGMIHARIQALVAAQQPRRDDAGDSEPLSVLSLTEENARVMLLLLKAQLAEFDKRKARSQR